MTNSVFYISYRRVWWHINNDPLISFLFTILVYITIIKWSIPWLTRLNCRAKVRCAFVCECVFVCVVWFSREWYDFSREWGSVDHFSSRVHHLPLTSSAAVYLTWAAGFWAWQVYRPVWCRVSLGMLSKLEYGSSVVTTTEPSPLLPTPLPKVAAAAAVATAADGSSPPPSCSKTGTPSLSHAMLSGGSPWLTPHTTLVRVPSTSPSAGKLKGSITGGTNGKTKQNYLR